MTQMVSQKNPKFDQHLQPIHTMFSHRGRPITLLFITLLFLFPNKDTSAQALPSGDLGIKKLPDTILSRRTLIVPDPFNATRALRGLFPGKWYDLTAGSKYKDQLISWVCPRCKMTMYEDANSEYGDVDTVRFPYSGGVATRLIKVFSYTDSSGKQYKVMSFNHSPYDPDGLQTMRFRGGLLGMAKFVRIDSGWQLQIFQPAIGAYGSFSQAPIPEPILIGDGQYAYMIVHVNGGPGGPFWRNNYLIAEVNGSYRQILSAYSTGRTDGFEGKSSWKCTYAVLPGEKHSFRDIVLVSKGHYWAADPERLPVELKGKVKGSEQGSFTITHTFVYSDKKGYQERRPARVSVKH